MDDLQFTRLQTFTKWPLYLNPKPILLAAGGFIYSGTGDRCICMICGLSLKNWKSSDIPIDIHMKKKPNCRFISSFNELQKMKFYHERLKTFLNYSKKPNIDPCRYVSVGFYCKDDEMRYITYKDFSKYVTRLESFKNRPVQTHPLKKVNPHAASREGFLYSGVDAYIIHESRCDFISDNNNSDDNDENDRLLCKICLEAEIDAVFQPCGHAAACITCATKIRDCCICRCKLEASIRIYI